LAEVPEIDDTNGVSRCFGSIRRDLVMKKGISMIETLRDFVAKANDLGIDFMVSEF
jgi:hypothetical protein